MITNLYSLHHPDYSILSGRILVDRLHRSTVKTFSEWVTTYGTGSYSIHSIGLVFNILVGENPVLNSDLVSDVMAHADELDEAIIHARDHSYHLYAFLWISMLATSESSHNSYSIHTLYKFYLLRVGDAVIERPQFLYMRIAVAINGRSLDGVLQTYHLLSTRAYSPATPTLYNAGTTNQYTISSYSYQPPISDTATVLRSVVPDVTSLWNSTAGVSIHLGEIPARQ